MEKGMIRYFYSTSNACVLLKTQQHFIGLLGKQQQNSMIMENSESGNKQKNCQVDWKQTK